VPICDGYGCFDVVHLLDAIVPHSNAYFELEGEDEEKRAEGTFKGFMTILLP